jgi:hypothetical protein
VVSFTPLLLYPQGKSPQFSFDMRLGRLQSTSGGHGKVKILDYWDSNFYPSVAQPVLTVLPRLL